MTDRNRPARSHTPTGSAPRLALIGCGAIAEEYYLPALAKLPSVRQNLVLVDRDQARLRRLAEAFEPIDYGADYREFLAEADGAILAVPTHLHYPLAMELLAQGMHVLCEKPLAESAVKARELVEQARRSGAALAVNYFQRLIPCFSKAKELLTDGILGKPTTIRYCVSEEFRWPTVSGFYFNSPTSSRGILRDRGAHVIDHICWWLGGKPSLLSSQNDSFGGSEAVAHIRFARGACSGEVRLSWLASAPCRFEIGCERGTIAGDVYDYGTVVVKDGDGRTQQLHLKSRERTKAEIADRVVANFVDVVAQGATPLVAGSDVLDSIEFIDECYSNATRLAMPWYETMEVARVP